MTYTVSPCTTTYFYPYFSKKADYVWKLSTAGSWKIAGQGYLGACPRTRSLLRKSHFGSFSRTFSLNMSHYSPQMAEKMDSKWLPLATTPILGQAPSGSCGKLCHCSLREKAHFCVGKTRNGTPIAAFCRLDLHLLTVLLSHRTSHMDH